MTVALAELDEGSTGDDDEDEDDEQEQEQDGKEAPQRGAGRKLVEELS